MNDVLIEGEPIELLQAAFRGMKARRDADGWVSVTGRLDRVPGEALLRALHRAETSLPRRLGSTREEHRAAALDEIARRFAAAVGDAPERAVPVERARITSDVAAEKFANREPGPRHLELVPVDE